VPHAVVRWFDADRGFGFLALDDGGEDLFVHASEIAMSGAFKLLREGQSVEFEVGEGDRGPQALRVRVTGESAPDSALGRLGTVVWYEPSKGYGFVEPDGGGSQIFVHSSAIVTGGVVSEGQRVAFLVGDGERGPQAEHLLPLASGVGGPAAGDGADGTVSWYDEGKGFGFVTPDSGGDDVFVHARALGEGLTSLSEGDRVAYEVVRGDKGPQARGVHLIRGAVGTGGYPSVPHGPAGRRRPADGRRGSGPVRARLGRGGCRVPAAGRAGSLRRAPERPRPTGRSRRAPLIEVDGRPRPISKGRSPEAASPQA
jgi:cold shock protein